MDFPRRGLRTLSVSSCFSYTPIPAGLVCRTESTDRTLLNDGLKLQHVRTDRQRFPAQVKDKGKPEVEETSEAAETAEAEEGSEDE